MSVVQVIVYTNPANERRGQNGVYYLQPAKSAIVDSSTGELHGFTELTQFVERSYPNGHCQTRSIGCKFDERGRVVSSPGEFADISQTEAAKLCPFLIPKELKAPTAAPAAVKA